MVPVAGIAAKPLPTLSAKTARYYSKVALRRNFKGGFYAGGFRADGCQRRSRVRVRCRVGWFQGDFTYDGHTVIWYTADETGVMWNYAYTITRVDTYCLQVLMKPIATCTKTYGVR
jgi:hypothetical protein